MELFRLTPEDRKAIEAADKARLEAQEKGPSGLTPDEMIALHTELAEIYPEPWTHENLGEADYIELAINGRFFDPRGMRPEYRPPLIRAIKTSAVRLNPVDVVNQVGTGMQKT